MKRMILLLACVFVTGTAYAGETVKGEFFVGGGVDPSKVAHTMITIKEGKYLGCILNASGRLSGNRLMLNADKIDCNGKMTKVKGSIYDEFGVKGVNVTSAVHGQRTIYPGQEVVIKFK